MDPRNRPEDFGQEGKQSPSEEAEEGSGPMKMGMGMMKRMMSGMGPQEGDPMGMMKKMMGEGPTEGGEPDNPMQKMMGMCREMLGALHKTTEMTVFSTPELRTLFEEWLTSLEDEALLLLRQQGEMDRDTLASALKIGPESATFLIARLVNHGKGVCRIQAIKEP